MTDWMRTVAGKAGSWPGVVLAIVISLVTYAANNGKDHQHVQEIERRVTKLEESVVQRQEMQDMKEWLGRVEGKLDRALSSSRR